MLIFSVGSNPGFVWLKYAPVTDMCEYRINTNKFRKKYQIVSETSSYFFIWFFKDKIFSELQV